MAKLSKRAKAFKEKVDLALDDGENLEKVLILFSFLA